MGVNGSERIILVLRFINYILTKRLLPSSVETNVCKVQVRLVFLACNFSMQCFEVFMSKTIIEASTTVPRFVRDLLINFKNFTKFMLYIYHLN